MRFNFSLFTILCLNFLLTCFTLSAKPNTYLDQEFSEQHVQSHQLIFSINAGVGVITNPLRGGDNVPLVVIPQIAFYAEDWFFDNGRLGYSLLQTSKHQLNIVSELNTESRFFIDWHPSNVLTLQSSSADSPFYLQAAEASSVKNVNLNDLHKRHLALDTGLAYHYVSDHHVFSVQLLHDVTNVYNGVRGALQWQYHTQLGPVNIKPSFGLNYKSAELNTYYYGLKDGETLLGHVEVASSWQPYAKIDGRLPLRDEYSVRFHLAYYDYSAINDSPLLERDYSMTAFIGFERTF